MILGLEDPALEVKVTAFQQVQKSWGYFQEFRKENISWGCCVVVKVLLCMLELLGSIPETVKIKKVCPLL